MSHSTEAHSTSHGSGHGHGDGEFSHPAPLGMLFAVFFALLFLTWLTVFQSTLNLGNMEVWLSLSIATVKAALVILFFMHMLWDKPFNAIIFLGTLIFVGLFIGFTMLDVQTYKDKIEDRDTLPSSLPAELLAPTQQP